MKIKEVGDLWSLKESMEREQDPRWRPSKRAMHRVLERKKENDVEFGVSEIWEENTEDDNI